VRKLNWPSGGGPYLASYESIQAVPRGVRQKNRFKMTEAGEAYEAKTLVGDAGKRWSRLPRRSWRRPRGSTSADRNG
jgi:hypothetical protein